MIPREDWFLAEQNAVESPVPRLRNEPHSRSTCLPSMNKSLWTNLIAAGVAVIGFMIPSTNPVAFPLRDTGLYALSGAFTNWLAIYMLFEKIPGLYGSGVIPSRFEEFKLGIRNLIMGQFFTRANVETFFKEQQGNNAIAFDPEPIIQAVDYDAMFLSLQQAVMSSSFGGMINMFGGTKALEALREPFKVNIEKEIRQFANSEKLKQALSASVKPGDMTDSVMSKVEGIVTKRLDELTPGMVKDIIQTMIREHLGWLVVWGGVFGGLIGLIVGFASRAW